MKTGLKRRTISQKRNDIARSVEVFLRTDAPAMREVRNKVLDPLQDIGEVAIVGGLVRDIIRYGVDRRPISDIDLVVEGSPSAVEVVAKRLGANRNRFGGFNFSNEYCKVDFWALSTTWARANANVTISKVSDLLDSTFFNWDAVLYSVTERKAIFKDNYLKDLSEKVLEINLETTASHKGNLIRALRRLYAWQAKPGPVLLEFIRESEKKYSWNDLLEQELAAFHNAYLNKFCGYSEYYDYLVLSALRLRSAAQLSLFSTSDLPLSEATKAVSWSYRNKASQFCEQGDAKQLDMPL